MTATAGRSPEAFNVFLHGCGLPQRWRGRERFVVLETRFGAGHNFLAAWRAWRADPQRCSALVFIAIEPRPLSQSSPTGADLKAAQPDASRDDPRNAHADALLQAWPVLTPNLHRLSFDDGRVQLLLVVAELQQGLAELVAHVDAIVLRRFGVA